MMLVVDHPELGLRSQFLHAASHLVSELAKASLEGVQSMEEKARHQEYPTREEADLIPKYLFDDPIFIIHMCHVCRALSRTLPAFHLDDEFQKIELKLCRICRATYNCQRRIKYFKHDLLCIKRRNDNTNC
ncbi:hypothetical protein CAEBREN_00833 [Caenorhabditis brenneri]|uniref:Uncharacterized protein n=1 Tax=Caenorhabditis brenneri TaxID=135651 RepID=G0NY65_CAEBE|nr:hypothetical protein CAEBREN_00833 [Caenorhabditis brenneri]